MEKHKSKFYDWLTDFCNDWHKHHNIYIVGYLIIYINRKIENLRDKGFETQLNMLEHNLMVSNLNDDMDKLADDLFDCLEQLEDFYDKISDGS